MVIILHFFSYTDIDIGQVTFDANAPEPQNKSFLFTVTDNNIALELDNWFTLGIRDPTPVCIAEPSQMVITVVDDDGNTCNLIADNLYIIFTYT